MKNYTLLFIILINTSLLFAQSTKTTSLGDFYKIKIFSGIKLELIKDKENKLEIKIMKQTELDLKITTEF